MDASEDEVVAERLRRNRLVAAARASFAAQVVDTLCGLQAQELPAARLAARPRSHDLTDATVEEDRVQKREFVRTWAMRGTLHLVASKDLLWLRRLLSDGIIRANARRSAQLGLDERTYSRALLLMDEALSGGRALTRAGLKEALQAGGIDSSGQRMAYLLSRASAEGLICEGAIEGRFPAYVRVEDWLDLTPPARSDRAEDMDRLVRRYLDAYGPAGPQDLATWSGLPVPECRDALGRRDLSEVKVGGKILWVTGDMAGGSPSEVRLLPTFDTFLLGYRDRSLHLDPAYGWRVNAGGGMVKPVLLVDGRVAGTWRIDRRAKKARLLVEPFGELGRKVLPPLEDEASDIGRFLEAEVDLRVAPGVSPA